MDDFTCNENGLKSKEEKSKLWICVRIKDGTIEWTRERAEEIEKKQ